MEPTTHDALAQYLSGEAHGLRNHVATLRSVAQLVDDAELVVALRSGLLRGGHALAFAGGGIVSGSSAVAELAETELKMRPFLDALGVDPASCAGARRGALR